MTRYDSAALQSAVTTEDESDGIIIAGDDGEIIDDVDGSEDGGRPDDCQCDGLRGDVELPCWSCYRAGFDVRA